MKHPVFWPLLSTFVFLLCGGAIARANSLLSPDVFEVPVSMQNVTMDKQIMLSAEVPAKTMDHMRGKFVVGNQVASLGIMMLTTFQTNYGAVIQAGGQLTIQDAGKLTAKYQPIVSIQTVPNSKQVAPTTGNLANNAGISNASGVVQGAQVAGSYNVVNQNVAIRIATDNTNPSDYASLFNGVSGKNQLSLTKDGITASSVLNQNGATIQILVPGSGDVMQSLRSGLSGSGLLQSTQLISNGNKVNSVMELNIQTALKGAAANQLKSALQGIMKQHK